MSSRLVYLYGPPASGKLTIAARVAATTGARLFHNHLTVDAVASVFEFGSPPFVELVHKFRLDVFAAAAREGTDVIFTNNSAWGGANPRSRFVEFADEAAEVVARHGGDTLFVQLTASLSVLESRIADDSRRSHGKLLDPVRLRELLATHDGTPLHPDDLVIDTADATPDEAAEHIVAALDQAAVPRNRFSTDRAETRLT